MKKCKLISLLLLLSLSSYAKRGSSAINVDFAPKLGLTQNIDPVFGERTKAGMGFNAQVSYSYLHSKSNTFLALGLGYSSYRLSVAEELLDLILPKNSFSYQFDYLQAFVKAGIQLKSPLPKLSITPYVGFRFLFYLPYENYKGTQYYVDRNFSKDAASYADLQTARYNKQLADLSYWTFIFTSGVQLKYNLNKRFDLNVAPFIDMGSSTLRTMFYTSDEFYEINEDDHHSFTAINKGDAFGVELGVSYKLGITKAR